MRSKLLLLPALLATACGDAGDSGGVGFGGAQDIGQFRSILENGELPGPETLDANGFFNEHFAEIPPADCGKALCLTPGLAVGYDWMTGKKQHTLQLAVSTNVDPTTYQRPPLDLVVVVDTSGSMSQDARLDKVKVGLHTLIDELEQTDRLSIVTFSTNVEAIEPFGLELDRPKLHDLVDELVPNGGTNIYAGLDAGFGQLDLAPREHQRRVIFLSDGLATEGNTSGQAIIDMAETNVKGGIGLTTVGVGTSFDVALMRGLAERGAGNFYYLEDATAATEVFSQELDYFVVPLALDLSLTANAGSGFTFGAVAGTKQWTGTADGGTFTIPAAFLASRTSPTPEPGRRGGGSTIFIQLIPTGESANVGDFVLTYRNPATDMLETQTVTLDYTGDDTETADEPHLSHASMAERYAMYNVFLGLRTATLSDGACARAALGATRSRAAAWGARHEEDQDIFEDLALIDLYIANLTAAGYTSEVSLASCPNATDPYVPEEPYEYGEGYDDRYRGCAAGGGTGGLGLALVGLALALRRRRR